MANLNPIQMNQPVKGFNSNASINGDSQESSLDQSFTSFPDELEAAKGQSQSAASGADASESKPEIIENIDLQNLPLTAGIGLVNPANIAAVIQVMAPVESGTVVQANLVDPLQLATLNTQHISLPNEAVTDLAPVLESGTEAQLMSQNLAASESLSVASQNIEATIVEDESTMIAQQSTAAISAQTVASSTVVAAPLAQAESSEIGQISSLNLSQQVLDGSKDLSKVIVPASSLGQVVASQTLTSNSQLDSQAMTNIIDTDLTTQVKDASVQQFVDAGDAQTLLNTDQLASQLATNKLEGSLDVTVLATNNAIDSPVNVTQVSVASTTVSNAGLSAAKVDVDVAASTSTAINANQVADSQQLEVNLPGSAQSLMAATVDLSEQVIAPVVTKDAKLVNVEVPSASNQVLAGRNISNEVADVTQTLNDGLKLEQATKPSEFVVDGQQIQLSRDDLAQTEDILVARSENAKLSKVDSGIQVDQILSGDIKDLNKIDTVSSGILLTDVTRSTFSANASQELQISQSAPAKLEPHHVSLASGPLNIEVMRVLKEGGGRVIMEVTPPDQGTLQLDLRLDNQGKAILIVDGASDSTRARLEQGSAELRQQLADMGLQLSLNMRQKSDSEGQFRFASSEGFNNTKNSINDSSIRNESGVVVPNQINSDGRVHLYA
jgi:hypothetical protein